MKRSLWLAAAFILALGPAARAQDDEEAAGPAAAAPPKISTFPVNESTGAARDLLAALAASTKTLSADQVIAGVEAADTGLRTLHCKFTQSLKIPGYGVDQKGAGELWFRKEKELRIEQSLPRKQTVVSDGKTLWIYTPDSNQVMQQDWSAFSNTQMASRGLVQFGNYAHLHDHYNVSVATATDASGRAAYDLTLAPKETQEMPYTLELTVGPPDFIPRATRMVLTDTRVETVLNDVDVNPTLADKTFAFTAPAGAVWIRPGAQVTP